MKTGYSYNINDFWDREMILDLPFSQLNKKGRKAKKKRIKNIEKHPKG